MKKAFTLIELMVAIFVLSIGILTVLAIFPLGIQVIKSSEMVTIGIQLSQEKIEEIISTPYEAISLGESSEMALSPPFDSYWRETRVSYVNPALDFQEVDTDKGIKKIEVTVFWKSPFKVIEKSIKLVTLISKR